MHSSGKVLFPLYIPIIVMGPNPADWVLPRYLGQPSSLGYVLTNYSARQRMLNTFFFKENCMPIIYILSPRATDVNPQAK